jgi:hypothetical protein
MSNYYLVFFQGNAFDAFSDWAMGTKKISKSGPYTNKVDAMNEAEKKHKKRACIVYHARNQICLHSQVGFVVKALPDLMHWAKTNIPVPTTLVLNHDMIDKQNEGKNWAISTLTKVEHNVNFTEYTIGVDNLTKMVTATIAGIVGNIPGILNAVSGLTIDICHGEDTKKDDEAWIKDITDADGNKGILAMKALTETSVKKKFFGKKEKKLSMNGIVCIMVPLTAKAKSECENLKNKHATNILTQIEKEFNFEHF